MAYSSGFVKANADEESEEVLDDEGQITASHLGNPVRVARSTTASVVPETAKRPNGISELIAGLRERTGGSLF
jgi:exosome complex RNA-binding protein Csl4